MIFRPSRGCRRAFAAVLAVLGLGPNVLAAEPAAPVVPAFERFHAESPDASGGLLLLGELNCTSCHAADEALSPHVVNKQAPILDDVASRVRLEWIRDFLTDPHAVKPGTTMPHVLAGVPEAERKETVEALVQFLSTTGAVADTVVEPKLIGEGGTLFHEIGCTACHAPREGVELNLATVVPLPEKFEDKYTVASLQAFLENPLAVRPSGRMPGQTWGKDEAKKVAHYLLRNLSGVAPVGRADRPKVPYAYYEGDWSEMPKLDELTPKATGSGAAFDVGLRRRNDGFLLKWDAVFEAKRDGTYAFTVGSDDGSRLWVDGELVVDNDGVHAYAEKTASVTLKQGLHEVRVAMFEKAGDEAVEAFVSGPGLTRTHLANVVAADAESLAKKHTDEPEPEDPDAFVFDEAKAAKGKQLFTSLGCANCHQLRDLKPTLTSKPLAGLSGRGGCLAPQPVSGTPFFAVSDAQRTALAKGVAAAKATPEPLAVADRIHVTMERFNCYTCHERGQVGGPDEARDPLFQITQKEMGDEGRVPPPLGGVGAKLTRNWMQNLLDKGTNDRPYMKGRMPGFGEKNVGHLVADFERADPLEQTVAIPEIDMLDRRVKALGREMSGDKVFGCIKCHNFAGVAGTGVQSIDLTIVTRRLKHDWFHAYMLNPQAFRPGTRMPAAWPLGQSTVPDILDGDAQKQIEAIWIYLADGGGAKKPFGLERNPIVLAADEEPRMYRNFIQGAGPRAIGVAYPEQANVAWNANEMSLALLWQGAFIDASKHWIGRGPGFQNPLGDQVVDWEETAPVAKLERPDDPWPTEPAKERGYEFEGYRFTKSRHPVFRYTIGDVLIEDKPAGVATKPYPSLERTIEAEGPAENLWFRAGTGGTIEKQDEGWYVLGDNVRVRITSDAEPAIVEVGGRRELRVPLTGKIVQEIRW